MENWTILGIDLAAWLSAKPVAGFLRCVAWIFIILPLVFWLARLARRRSSAKFTPQYGMILGRLISYSGLAVVTVAVMKELGFPLTHLLGAAGVAGIALGFASQTSVSNIISGLFLMAEKPFVVGDVITVGGVTGAVLSIDTLSVKMRTFDNKMVRIPNEILVKSEMTNVTRFPIRRIDLSVGVAYKENLARVREVLLDVAHRNPLCLQEPEPMVILSGYGNSSIDMLFVSWAVKENWLKVKSGLLEEVKQRFDEEGIEIPFPHLSLYSGLATEPIPIKIIQEPPPS